MLIQKLQVEVGDIIEVKIKRIFGITQTFYGKIRIFKPKRLWIRDTPITYKNIINIYKLERSNGFRTSKGKSAPGIHPGDS